MHCSTAARLVFSLADLVQASMNVPTTFGCDLVARSMVQGSVSSLLAGILVFIFLGLILLSVGYCRVTRIHLLLLNLRLRNAVYVLSGYPLPTPS